MEMGNVVKVINPNLKSYMKEGITQYLKCEFPKTWEVKLDDGQWITIKESNLSIVTSPDAYPEDEQMTSTDDGKYLAFVHYHDYDRNPTDLEGALELFDEEELGASDLTVYGTKDEILERILDDSDLHSYENAFIILNQNVYPLKKSVNVDW